MFFENELITVMLVNDALLINMQLYYTPTPIEAISLEAHRLLK